MKKLLYIILALFMISCGSLSKTLNGGQVAQTNYKEIIDFNYDYNFALIDVIINKKKYIFLVDTGAPTVISHQIYRDLNVDSAHSTNVTDSQGQSNNQEVVIIPDVRIGKLVYNDIGAVVADLRNVFEFNCMGIDGIIGANQMAKSFWKFDYQNQKITITDQLDNFDISSYRDSLQFYTSAQKTPYVLGFVNGVSTNYTYDTGFAGHLDVDRDIAAFDKASGYVKYGSSSIGLYDVKDSISTRTIKVDSLKIGGIDMGQQIVELDHGSLIGNDFMNKHDVIIDWSSNIIYLNKLNEFEKAEKSAFGFQTRFKDNKAIVVALIREVNLELQLGDQLLRINDYDLRELNDQTSCDIYNDLELEDLKTLDIIYMRDGKEYSTTLKRVKLIE
ncbi:clan AA aspartic protease [Nonlabens mediterrranea]|uniref:Clan AA aspartic protease n=1 Tax=Nonlabens mediterrranea TaxID=1419947 RepID=A0ABS0A551_9FLAO|nr:clan AA aspartic protease [Nonlabens mediterrranea]